MPMSATHSATESAVGLTQSEVVFLRQQQQAAAQRSHSGTAPERGRGPTRTSHHSASSRAASAASSQSVSGRILLDPNSLTSLGLHVDSILASISGRIDELTNAAAQSVERTRNQANRTIRGADAEIDRCRSLLAQVVRLEHDQEEIVRIRNKVKTMRRNVDALGERLDRSRHNGHSSAARPRR